MRRSKRRLLEGVEYITNQLSIVIDKREVYQRQQNMPRNHVG